MGIVTLGKMTTEAGVDVTLQAHLDVAPEGGPDYYELIFAEKGDQAYTVMLQPAELEQLSALLPKAV
jgi:hypothetical protein